MQRSVLIAIVLSAGLYATTDFSKLSVEELLALRGSVSAREIKSFSRELRTKLRTLSPQKRRALMSKSSTAESIAARARSRSTALDVLNGNFGAGAAGAGGGGHGGGGHGAAGAGGGGHGGGGHGGGHGGR